MQQTLDVEEWRPVVGYEGWYEVSSLGHVRRCAPNPPNRYGVIRKGRVTWNGYRTINLSVDNRLRSFLVHRLVAAAFLPHDPTRRDVNHINGIRTDNRAMNLEWCTPKENAQNAALRPRPKGWDRFNPKISDADVIDLRRKRAEGWSVRRLASHFNISVSYASMLYSGKSRCLIGSQAVYAITPAGVEAIGETK